MTQMGLGQALINHPDSVASSAKAARWRVLRCSVFGTFVIITSGRHQARGICKSSTPLASRSQPGKCVLAPGVHMLTATALGTDVMSAAEPSVPLCNPAEVYGRESPRPVCEPLEHPQAQLCPMFQDSADTSEDFTESSLQGREFRAV